MVSGYWRYAFGEVVVVVVGFFVVLFVDDWVGGWVDRRLREMCIGVRFGVGLGLGMPAFAVQLCFGNPLWQKFLCWWMGVLLLCLWVIG